MFDARELMSQVPCWWCRRLPSFLYAMPFSDTRVFLEETSLVARPAVAYKELKGRLDKRLRHMGISVRRVKEEEYCLIPMGGALPRLPQRVLGIGGTGGMVHPSTGTRPVPPPLPPSGLPATTMLLVTCRSACAMLR